MTYSPGWEGSSMGSRDRKPFQRQPITVTARVNGRNIAEITFADDGIGIRAVVIMCKPDGISGPDKERAVASIIAANKALDPKEDSERIYQMLWKRPGNA